MLIDNTSLRCFKKLDCTEEIFTYNSFLTIIQAVEAASGTLRSPFFLQTLSLIHPSFKKSRDKQPGSSYKAKRVLINCSHLPSSSAI